MTGDKTEGRIKGIVKSLLQLADVEEPPVPVERIAQLRGARLKYVHHDSETSGLLYKEINQIIIGINAAHPKNRQRFTIAHELGHLELDDKADVHVDRDFPVYRRDARSSQAIDPIEIEANAFAAELLMPAFMLERDLQDTIIDFEDDKLVRSLADRYQVSAQAMTIRLLNLIQQKSS